jgi:hypothetical protein
MQLHSISSLSYDGPSYAMTDPPMMDPPMMDPPMMDPPMMDPPMMDPPMMDPPMLDAPTHGHGKKEKQRGGRHWAPKITEEEEASLLTRNER